ncbi:hypothetical protein M431DRAFT_493853 [Trichoderma harzianum CBS 226.95]|uniref:Uncharacterized protein n=1 Tax=Trichoderma harzianum CBS 226.95 TaxID=983964 RepID=A0A2T4AEE4_TRIHA|nr:hypothetical protein M431DRAFT_493853 [Trichoderma harzianum CBS 226.95]PTB55416.1 hypothetical protein M431DRAFT_493853 [Trichoderma harzianum CBS 226.95]
MTMLYIGVSADSVCFRRCTSHNCTKYLALARFRCDAAHHQHQTAPSPNPGRIPACPKKGGFRAPNLRAHSTCGHFSYHGPRQQRHRLCQDARTHDLIDGDGSNQTTAEEIGSTHPLRPGWLTPPVAVQPTPLSLDAVTFRQGRWKSKKRHRTARATALGAAGWGSGTTEPLRSPARARPDPDASQVRSTGVAAPVPSCPALAVLATSLRGYLSVPIVHDRGPVPLSSYPPHPLLSLRCAAAAAAVPLPTEIP